jgi:hypothetical protein
LGPPGEAEVVNQMEKPDEESPMDLDNQSADKPGERPLEMAGQPGPNLQPNKKRTASTSSAASSLSVENALNFKATARTVLY